MNFDASGINLLRQFLYVRFSIFTPLAFIKKNLNKRFILLLNLQNYEFWRQWVYPATSIFIFSFRNSSSSWIFLNKLS